MEDGKNKKQHSYKIKTSNIYIHFNKTKIKNFIDIYTFEQSKEGMNFEMQRLNVIYEDNHIIVVEKIVNVPSQSDKTGDTDMLSMVKNYIKEKYNKPGNVYIGLVHRLDRPVGGVMVFAKTSKAASRLSNQVREKTMKKQYLAVVDGKIEKQKRNIRKLFI